MAKSLLLVCPSCERHVRAVDAACPFCGLGLSPDLRATLALRPPRARLSRAALYAVSMGTMSLAPACGGNAISDSDGGGGSESGAESGTGAETGKETGSGFDGACCPPYGIPADAHQLDAGSDSMPQEASNGGDGPSEGTIFPPYGIPPSD